VRQSEATVRSILTRTTGYLRTVTSHSLQPYRGCSYGNALCGVGCYVRHNGWVTRGEAWGSFLEARTNAALKRSEWGVKWFMLPNPMYGSWEASLYDFRADLSRDEVSRQKFNKLR